MSSRKYLDRQAGINDLSCPGMDGVSDDMEDVMGRRRETRDFSQFLKRLEMIQFLRLLF